MATYSTFIAQVRRELEEDTQSTFKDASLLRWTNDAIKDVCLKLRPLFDEQYADAEIGVAAYELPTYTLEIAGIAYNDKFLTRLSPNAFFRVAELYTDNGTPLYYSVVGGTLYLTPTPDATDQIQFWRKYYLADITSVADMPFGSKYDMSIAYYVKSKAYEQVGDFDSFKLNDEMYNRSLSDFDWSNTLDEMSDTFFEPLVVW